MSIARIVFVMLAIAACFPVPSLAKDRGPMGLAPAAVMNDPSSLTGKKVRIRGLNCVDVPKGDFVCVVRVGGRFLKLDGLILGEATSVEVAEHVMNQCTGTLNLGRPACRFDVQMTPRSFERSTYEGDAGSAPVLVLYGRQIDFFRRDK